MPTNHFFGEIDRIVVSVIRKKLSFMGRANLKLVRTSLLTVLPSKASSLSVSLVNFVTHCYRPAQQKATKISNMTYFATMKSAPRPSALHFSAQRPQVG